MSCDAGIDALLAAYKTPAGIIGHIAYLAGLADADEPATPEALLAGFDVRTLPQRFPDRVQILWR